MREREREREKEREFDQNDFNLYCTVTGLSQNDKNYPCYY